MGDQLQSVLGSEDRFDRWAGSYDDSALQNLIYRPVHDIVLDQAARHAPRAARILDVGCGTGQLAARLAERFPEARRVGVDPSAPMLGACAAAGEPPRSRASATRASAPSLVRGCAEHLPFRDAAFDLVVSTLSLRHWTDPAAGIAQLARVCATGGVVIVADAFEVAPGRFRRMRRRAPGLRTAFRRAGFEVRVMRSIPLAIASAVLVVAEA